MHLLPMKFGPHGQPGGRSNAALLIEILPGTFHLSSSRLTGGSEYTRSALVTVISLLSLFFIRLVCHLKSFIAPASYYHTVSSVDMHFRVLLLLQSKWCFIMLAWTKEKYYDMDARYICCVVCIYLNFRYLKLYVQYMIDDFWINYHFILEQNGSTKK